MKIIELSIIAVIRPALRLEKQLPHGQKILFSSTA